MNRVPVVESTSSSKDGGNDAAGASLVAALPQSLVERARTTSWDNRTSAALELFVLATFDADGNGSLDDIERITAVRALRDAAWPDNATETAHEMAVEAPGFSASTTLSEQDRQLHHDVDEARRRDRQEEGAAGDVVADLRAEFVHRFQVDDDGHLTVAELSRYLIHRKAGSAKADLNSDGQIDDADLRMFLDVASPIDGPIDGPINEP